MNSEDLIRMANQIADYYRPYPRDEAVKGVADHIIAFWDPRMRTGLAEIVAHGGMGLSELALTAARRVVAPAAA